MTGDETTTTQPPGSDAAAVRPYIERLLAAWDEAMTPILRDPQAVSEDPAHPLRAALAESFTDDSPYVRDLAVLLDDYVSRDTGMLPGPTGLVQQTTFLGFTQTPDGDNLEFAFCTFTDGVDFSLSTGEERPSPPTAGLRSGEAIRVDGRWLLNELQLVGSELPFDTVNPCAAFAAAEGG